MFRMRTMLTMGAGYAVGYLAGAKAGRPAYDRVMATVARYKEELGLTGHGEALAAEVKGGAQQVAQTASATVQDATGLAAQRANDQLTQLRERLHDVPE